MKKENGFNPLPTPLKVIFILTTISVAFSLISLPNITVIYKLGFPIFSFPVYGILGIILYFIDRGVAIIFLFALWKRYSWTWIYGIILYFYIILNSLLHFRVFPKEFALAQIQNPTIDKDISQIAYQIAFLMIIVISIAFAIVYAIFIWLLYKNRKYFDNDLSKQTSKQLVKKEYVSEAKITEELPQEKNKMKKRTIWIIAIVVFFIIVSLCSACTILSKNLYPRLNKALKNNKPVYTVTSNDVTDILINEEFIFEIEINNVGDRDIKIEKIVLYNQEINEKLFINIYSHFPEENYISDSTYELKGGKKESTKEIGYCFYTPIVVPADSIETIKLDGRAIQEGEYVINIKMKVKESPIITDFYDIYTEEVALTIKFDVSQ